MVVYESRSASTREKRATVVRATSSLQAVSCGRSMEGWHESLYGRHIAAVYDQRAFGAPSDTETEEAVSFLSELLAGTPGRLLEQGSGTGRLLVPLAERGFSVQGVELSPEMVAQMNEKPGGQNIPVVIEDMTSFELDERFDIVLLAYNTLFSLTSQARQVQCLENAAGHLAGGGRLVLEAYAPYPMTKLPPKNVLTYALKVDEVVLMPTLHNQVDQTIEVNIVVLREDGIRLYPSRVRYAWPPEIDLMARLAGLALDERWADWSREPFGSNCDSHVSVYAAPALAASRIV
jgi:SAM-dependent methyltransferase